jgi:hypothetical protein
VEALALRSAVAVSSRSSSAFEECYGLFKCGGMLWVRCGALEVVGVESGAAVT